jgi:predicted amidohydrolase
MLAIGLLAASAAPIHADGRAAEQAPHGWQAASPRDEIRPMFTFLPQGGRAAAPCWRISGANCETIDGAWTRTFAIRGGHVYRFSAFRKTEHVSAPWRGAVVKITWQDDRGNLVACEREECDDKARPEYPLDRETTTDGWTVVSDVYQTPRAATQARVELGLRWTRGTVCWSNVVFEEVPEKPRRIVRLAAVHFQPRDGRTRIEKCRQFAPLIAKAAERRADLVVLPESLTYYRSGSTMADVAEPIPGPSTQYFGQLAKQHNLYIVAGLTERDGTVVYNTAALLAPDGRLAGKYRKVCLPREEVAAGVTPGNDYPVFDTRFGRIGIMICWDVHFPEVARRLSNQGAEVIALPIWGGNPTLAAARAIENQIYLITSTYTEPDRTWMKSGIWDHEGQLLAEGKQWGDVLVTEVDLECRTHWWWLGDFKARIARERPE